MISKETLLLLKTALEQSVFLRAQNVNGFLQLEFRFGRLIIQSSWRLIKGGEIRAGSGAESEWDKSINDMLQESKVSLVSISSELNDLTVRFDNGAALETFADSEDFEHWSFHYGDNNMIVGGPGSLWSSF